MKKSQGPKPALPTKVPLPWCPFQPLLRRPSLHPDGFNGAVQPPWAMPGVGILPPTHSFGLEGTWPPPPNLCPGSPVLSTSPLVFPVPLYWILSQGTRAVREGGRAPTVSWSQDQARCLSWNRRLILSPWGITCPPQMGRGASSPLHPQVLEVGALPRAKGRWLAAGGWPLALETPAQSSSSWLPPHPSLPSPDQLLQAGS